MDLSATAANLSKYSIVALPLLGKPVEAAVT
jgi:hypothetical protein